MLAMSPRRHPNRSGKSELAREMEGAVMFV
jgi:hypothetical protein